MEIMFILLTFFHPPMITSSGTEKTDIYHNEFAVHIKGGLKAANRIAQLYGFENNGQIGSLEDHYLFWHSHVHKRSTALSYSHHDILQNHPEVLWFEQQKELKRKKRDLSTNKNNNLEESIHDPLYRKQWFINGGAYDGTDMNVIPAWQKGITGKGVVVTILDDGIQRDHPDLKQNYDPKASTDINGGDSDPMPQDNGDNKHGTRCAGEVAAVAFNEYCGVGVAYNASIGGVRMLDGMVNDAVEARALSLNPQHVDIYSASWGPEDDGKTVDGPGPLAKKAFLSGINNGRGGKGSIFVWASGNGGRKTDNCNCDGYTNSPFTLSISSATQGGKKPWYLEECSSTLATTYSSGTPSHDASITTVDQDKRLRADKMCTSSHTGTSASAPIAAGMCALVLEANKEITWRDMQHIVLQTTNPKPLLHEEGWATNGVGRKFSHKFGYGLMDGAAMVNLAEKWKGVGTQLKCESEVMYTESEIPASPDERSKIFVTADSCNNKKEKRINFLEHVQCIISLKSVMRGAIKIILISPLGTKSTLLYPRPKDHASGSFEDWPFMSVHFWGEPPNGTWTLEVGHTEQIHSGTGNIIKKVQLVIYGTEMLPQLKGSHSIPNSKHKYADIKYNVIEKENKKQKHTSSQPLNFSLSYEYANEGDNVMLVKNYSFTPNVCKNDRFFDHLGQSCVLKCPNNTFQTFDRSCYPCSNRCNTCYGPLSNQCTSCKRHTEFMYYIKTKSSCYKGCPEGYYMTNYNSIKKGNMIGSVVVGEDYYGVDEPEVRHCEKCSSNCANCSVNNKCLSCKDNLILDNQTCVSDCPVGKYVQEIKGKNGKRGLICDFCHKTCDTCTGKKPGQCAKCKKGFFFYERSCVKSCPIGYVEDDNTGECAPCPQGCDICTPPRYHSESATKFLQECMKCEQNWKFVDDPSPTVLSQVRHGKCIPNSSKQQCDKSCASCFKSGSSGCVTCHPGHVLHIDSCSDHCPPSTYFISTYFNSTTEKALTTTKIENVLPQGGAGECRHCPHTCKTCDNLMRCTACHKGYVLRDKEYTNNLDLPQEEVGWVECATSCGDGYYTEESQQRVCRKCSEPCKTCSSKATCLSCHPNSFLTPNGSCVKECPNGYFRFLGEVIPYDDIEDEDSSYSLEIPYSNFWCKDCHSSCATCSGPSGNECLSCKPGFAWSKLTKSCLPCDPGRYFDKASNQCQNCHNDCAICHGPNLNDCDRCKPPLRKDNWNQTCAPCCGSAREVARYNMRSDIVQDTLFSSLPSIRIQNETPKYCCQCDKHFTCLSPSYEGKFDDGSGKRSIFVGSTRMSSMVSASTKSLMLLSIFVMACFVTFLILKRRKRMQRRRNSQASGKRKRVSERLLSLFSFPREKKYDNIEVKYKKPRNGNLYSYRQIPTSSSGNGIPEDYLQNLEDSDSEEYDHDEEKRNHSRKLYNLYIDQEDNQDTHNLLPGTNLIRNKE